MKHYACLLKHGLAFEPDPMIYGCFVGNDVEEIHPGDWIEQDVRARPIELLATRFG